MTHAHHQQTLYPEHPFAEFIRILGKGKKGSRPFTQDEAYQAMRLILTDQTEPVQLGAFLMLMRIKEETPEELAGFAQAAQELSPFNKENIEVDLDWSSYAGKRRHLPWFLLAALLLAGNGIRILMHGSSGHNSDRLYTEYALSHLGIDCAASSDDVHQQLNRRGFSYLSLAYLYPKLFEIIELRPLLGLRSPVHTLVRLLNPCRAPFSIQGIFHPGYRPVHQQAAALLQQPHMAVLKGEGGETERNPDVDCLVQSVHDGKLSDENWPAFFSHRHVKAELLDPKQLAMVWQGLLDDEYATATITGTAAVALKLLGKAQTQLQAQQLATEYWSTRDKSLNWLL